MNTYKAVGTIHTAEPTRDPAEMDRRNKPGGAPETKILTPGTFFNPDEHHLSKDAARSARRYRQARGRGPTAAAGDRRGRNDVDRRDTRGRRQSDGR